MSKEKDWRLAGQENYLQGVSLVKRMYRQYEKSPKWDHDHCDFCWAKYSLLNEKALKEGYATLDDYHWICFQCFEDFKERFNWVVVKDVG